MLKRLGLKRRDSDKSLSPTSSPERQVSPDISSDISTETEGFICPKCMKSLGSADALQAHFSEHSVVKQEFSDGGEGFLCPLCKKPLPSQDALEDHYMTIHEENHLTAQNRQEVEELKKSLKNEKWYIEELKKELEKYQKGNSTVPFTREDQAELDRCKLQAKSLEENRKLLSDEVGHLKQMLDKTKQELQTMCHKKESIEQKAALLAGDVVVAKAKVDECEGQSAALEDHITTLKKQLDERNDYARGLESQLAQRPGADDVIVLKQELISVQTLMDRMTQDREKEKEELEKQNKELLSKHEKSLSKVGELTALLENLPKREEVTSLHSLLVDKEKQSEEVGRTLQLKDEEISQLKKQNEKVKKQVDNLQKKLNDEAAVCTKLENDLADAKSELDSVQRQWTDQEQRQEQIEIDYTVIKGKYGQQVEEQVNQINKLHSELDIRNGELIQLRQQLEENEKKATEMNEELEKVSKALSFKTSSLESLQQQLGESRSKSQEMLHQKKLQVNEMKLEQEKFQAQLESLGAQVDDLTKQLNDVTQHYQSECVNNNELKGELWEKTALLEEEVRRCKMDKEKMKELESQLGKMRAEVQRLEAERTNLISKIEAGDGVETAINQLKQENVGLQEKLTTVENTLQLQSADFLSEECILHKQIQEVKGQLQVSQDKNQKLEVSLNEKDEKLNVSLQKLQQLEGELKVKVELLLASEGAKTSQRADLENHIKTTQNILNEKVEELKRLKQEQEQAETEIESKKEKISQLEEALKEERDGCNQMVIKCSGLERAVDEKSKALKEKEEMVQHLELKLSDAHKNWDDAKTLSTQTLAALEQMKKEHAKEVKSFKKQHDKVQAVKEDLSQQLQQMGKSLDEKEKLCRDVEKNLTNLKKAFDDMKLDYQHQEQTLDTVRKDYGNQIQVISDKLQKGTEEAAVARQQLENQVSLLMTLKDKLSEEKKNVENQLGEMKKNLENKIKELASEKEKYEQEKSVFKGKFQKTEELHNQEKLTLTSQLTETTKLLQAEKDSLSAKIENEVALKQEVEALRSEKSELFSSMTNLKGELQGLDTQLHQLRNDTKSKQQELEEKIDEKEREEAELLAKIKLLESEKCELKTNLKTTQASLQEIQDKLDRTTDDLHKSLDNEKDLNISLEQLSEVRTAMNAQMLELDGQLQETTTIKEDLEKQKNQFKLELAELCALHEGITKENSILTKNLADVSAALAEEKTQRLQEVSELQKAKQLLIAQKLDLQNKGLELDIKLKDALEEHKGTKVIASQNHQRLEEEKLSIMEQLASKERSCESLNKAIEENQIRFDLQLSVLDENLTTVRGDLIVSQQQNEEMTKVTDELRGEKLELEAKLENNNDERRVLLERCLASENEREKLRERLMETTRKLDNTQAALQELGRENQSLQIMSTKVQNRKWTEDNEVSECRTCGRAFSVTIRKHHCRNCGNIFCNECSAKSAMIASAKKAVRVCDNCFDELTSTR